MIFDAPLADVLIRSDILAGMTREHPAEQSGHTRLRGALLLGFLALNSRANYPRADDGRQNVEFGGKLFAVFLRHGERMLATGQRAN